MKKIRMTNGSVICFNGTDKPEKFQNVTIPLVGDICPTPRFIKKYLKRLKMENHIKQVMG